VRAAIIDQPGRIRVGTLPDPAPAAGEIVVKVGACGICGTDQHIAAGEFPPTPYPIVPGHEFAGEVVEVGAGVTTGVSVGDRVAVDPSLFCGYCGPCRAGHGNLCANWNATGDTVNGAFAELVSVPAANAYPLPESLSFRQGALVEPLSCAVHGIRRIGDVLGRSVLIVGAGTMGLMLQQLLLRAGAARVVVVDRNPARLPPAQKLGAHAVATDVTDLRGERFEVSVDVTGAAPAIEAAFDALQRGGRLLIFGVAEEKARVALSPFRIYNDEITVAGSMAVLHSYGAALGLMTAGAVDTDPILTHALALEEFPRALDLMRAGEGVKIQVLPNGPERG
jgi:2-desacetyl-2-hydroxyethyl bacteriochlorophyllide A dehydrogenase